MNNRTIKEQFEYEYSAFKRADNDAFKTNSDGTYVLNTVRDAWNEYNKNKVLKILRGED